MRVGRSGLRSLSRPLSGEQVADDFLRWFEETLQQRTVHSRKPSGYRELLSRLDVLENEIEVRFAK